MNPTLAGLLSVLIWSAALPLNKLLDGEIGMLATIGIIYFASGVLGLAKTRLQGFTPAAWRSPALYMRWFFFVFHVTILCTGIQIVSKAHMPMLVLCNYLWPTAILLFSVLLAGVRITRPPAFVIGTCIVVLSLLAEIVGPSGLRHELFVETRDCIAYLFAFIGALSWALYSVISRKAGDVSGGGSAVPLFQLTVGLALPIAFIPAVRFPWELSSTGAILLASYSVAQFIALLCWDFGMRQGNIVVLSLLADFIPWLSLFFTWLLIKVEIDTTTIASAVALVCGAMLTRYGTLVKKAPLVT